ncbi:hypothetical protein DITRI_Ditri14bG0148000 [Diplodiscus trichospermus]
MLPMDSFVLDASGSPGIGSKALTVSLKALKLASVHGIGVEVWWGIVERFSPFDYSWSMYEELFKLMSDSRLKLDVALSFHSNIHSSHGKGGVSLPLWILEVQLITLVEILPSNPPTVIAGILLILLMTVDGNSLALVNSSVMISTCGCKPFSSYDVNSVVSVFSRSFCLLDGGLEYGCMLRRSKASMGGTEVHRMLAVTTVFHQGCLLFSFFFLNRDRKDFCLIMAVSSWYNSNHPFEFDALPRYSKYRRGVLSPNVPCWSSDRIHCGMPSLTLEMIMEACLMRIKKARLWNDLLQEWYSGRLICHADAILAKAAKILKKYQENEQTSVILVAKIDGIYWWYLTLSHPAELTAGYYNTALRDRYDPVVSVLSCHGTALHILCLEMMDSETPPTYLCSPEGLLKQA